MSASENATIGNDRIAREVSWDGGRLTTRTIANRIGHSQAEVAGGDEFALTVRLGGTAADRDE